MNTTIYHDLIKRYDRASYTHEYIFGFESNGSIVFTFGSSDLLPYICKLDRASRGAGYSLRFKPDYQQKELLKLRPLTVLCSADYFRSTVKNSKYNAGEVFEKMVTEWYEQEWKKDHIPFTEAGDIEIDGIAYQIKFERATFTNEKTLAKLGA